MAVLRYRIGCHAILSSSTRWIVKIVKVRFVEITIYNCLEAKNGTVKYEKVTIIRYKKQAYLGVVRNAESWVTVLNVEKRVYV